MAVSVTTPGRLILKKILPDGLRTDDEVVDKKTIQRMMKTLAEKAPDRYVDVFQDIMENARHAAYVGGKISTVSLDDLIPSPETQAIQNEMKAEVRKIAQSDTPFDEKNKQIAAYVMSKTKDLAPKILDIEAKRGNRFALFAKLGFRSNADQFQQIIFGDAMNADYKGRAIPIAAFRGYGQCVSPLQYWSGAYSARKGDVDTQFATAETGYFSKQVSNAAASAVVSAEDCGTKNGDMRRSDDPDVLGSVLANSVGDYPAGSIITRSMAKSLAGKPVVVRTTMTCQANGGVCQKCSGVRDSQFPKIGSFIGIESGRIATEPLTQGLALNSRHVGGTAGVNEKNMSAFQEINQFVNVPETFVGGAALAPVDGAISKIEDAPQGGKYIHIGGEKTYVHPETPVSVKVGQKVEAGDALSDGTVNLRTYAELRSVGEARKYFADALHKILADKGQPTSRKNVDILAREIVGRVEVTNPDGIDGYDVGEVVSYDDLAKRYQPPKDSADMPAAKSVGQYIQSPVLHYTIGTRITPSVVKNLQDAGIASVNASPQEPGFKSHISRLIDIPSKNPDWMVRLTGWNVKRSFVDAAQKGSVSDPARPSYARKMILPEELGEEGDDENDPII